MEIDDMRRISTAAAASALFLALSAPSFAADVNTSGTTASPSGGSTSSGSAGDLGKSYSNTAPGQQNSASLAALDV
jgi:Spy/CpxP family protein refolding chaperone